MLVQAYQSCVKFDEEVACTCQVISLETKQVLFEVTLDQEEPTLKRNLNYQVEAVFHIRNYQNEEGRLDFIVFLS